MKKDGGLMAVDFKKIEEQMEFENHLQRAKPFFWYGQKVLFKTHLFGKDYFWMEDGDNTVYLVKCNSQGLPDYS